MKIVSLMQHEAYLSGVLKGDGWCTRYIGLRVADRDFAERFALSITSIFGTPLNVRQDERGYWLVRTSNKTGKYMYLLTREPLTKEEKVEWIKGLFDSEGNAQLQQRMPNCYERRVAIYSTNRITLETASQYLEEIGLPHHIRATKNSANHKGTKIVYELRLRSRKEHYELFCTLIGSSIARKQTRLDAIVESYSPLGRSEYARKGQLLGAAAKHKKTIEITLPSVVDGIRVLIQSGVKPTQRNCRIIPGYGSVQKYFHQADLIARALEAN